MDNPLHHLKILLWPLPFMLCSTAAFSWVVLPPHQGLRKGLRHSLLVIVTLFYVILGGKNERKKCIPSEAPGVSAPETLFGSGKCEHFHWSSCTVFSKLHRLQTTFTIFAFFPYHHKPLRQLVLCITFFFNRLILKT